MAKKQEVLLVADVLKLGNMGDLVKVAPGYARNYLYPHGMAIPASRAQKRQVEVLREKAQKNELEREGQAKALQTKMLGVVVQLAGKVAHDDELFGSLGAKELVAALAKKGFAIDQKQVHMHDKMRRLGRYEVEVRLHKNVPVTVKVEVVSSDPNAPSLDDTLAAIASARAEREASAKAAKEAAKAAAAAEPVAADAAATADAKAAEAKPGKGDAKPAKGDGKTTKSDAKPGKDAKAEGKGKPDKPAKGEGTKEAKAGKAGKNEK